MDSDGAKYALWLLCLVSFGFLFVLPVFEHFGPVEEPVRNGKVERGKRFILPQSLPNLTEWLKPTDAKNLTTFVHSAINKVANLTQNLGKRVMNRLNQLNSTNAFKIEIFNGKDIRNDKAAEELKARLRGICGNSTASGVISCANAIIKEIGTDLKTVSNDTHHHIVLNMTLSENTEIVLVDITLEKPSRNWKPLNGGDSKTPGLPKGFSLPNFFGGRGDKKGVAALAAAAPRISHKPKSNGQSWDKFSGNKHIKKPIVVSTFPPPHKKAKDGKKKSGPMDQNKGNNNNVFKGMRNGNSTEVSIAHC